MPGRGRARARDRAARRVGSQSAACTSSGSISTTARRSTRARRTARATSAIAVSGPCTRSATAPTDSTRPVWSIRKFERSAAAGVSAASSSSGVRLLAASVSPVIVFVSPGSLVHAAGGELPAHARVAVGHADRAALVARGDEPRAGVAQRVRERQVAAAEQPEDGVDPVGGQRPPDRLGDQHGLAVSERRVGTARRRSRRGSRRPPRSSRGRREDREDRADHEHDRGHAADDHEVVRPLLARAARGAGAGTALEIAHGRDHAMQSVVKLMLVKRGRR